jgi:hypothetical protein
MVIETTLSAHASRRSSVRHIIQQLQRGKTLAAADHLLVRRSRNDLATVIEDLMGQLPSFLKRHKDSAQDVFTMSIRIGLNMVGQDVKVARIPAKVVRKA